MNNNKLTNRVRKLLALSLIPVASLLLVACGGGGGSDPVIPTLTVSNVSMAEGNSGSSNLVFILSLSSAAGSNASVAYATTDNSATAGSDYTTQTGTATFTAGATSATITIPVLGDTTIEPDETLTLTLSTPLGVKMATATLTATGTITNDDNGGYFTGSASITAPALTITDEVKAIFNNDEFVIASVANDLLYKGTITSRTGTAYTASVRIYKTGVYVRDAAVTGEFTSGGLVDGTLSGTGDYTNGTFTLTYSGLNSRAPLVFVDTNYWYAHAGASILMFTSNTTADIELGGAASSDYLDGCDMTGTTLVNVNSEQTGRLRQFSSVLTGCNNTDPMAPPAPAQGYFTSFDLNGTDNALLFILFNDNDAQISILDCPQGVCPP